MDLQNKQESVENQKLARKPYWKPSVQVYGNLRETTQASARTPTPHRDGPTGWNTRT